MDVPGGGRDETARVTAGGLPLLPDGPEREARLDAAVLRALFERSPTGLHVLDTELRIVRFSTAAPGMRHVDLDAARGHTWAELGLPGAEPLQRKLRGVLATGDAVRDHFYAHRVEEDERPRRLYLSAYRLEEADGRVLGVVVTVADRTDRDRYREGLRLVNEAGRRIGSTLDLFRTAQELAELAVSDFAQVASVDILDLTVHGDAPARGPLPHTVTLRRAGFAHALRPEATGVVPVGQVRLLDFGTPQAQTLMDPRPRLVRQVRPDDDWLLRDPVLARLLRAGVYSLLVVPLVARGMVLGLATLYRLPGRPPFDEEDLTVAAELADRTALSLDNARLYTREHSLASLVRRRMIPSGLPRHSAVDTAHSYLPAHSAGTWYDVLPLSGARVGLGVGEVLGEGLAAVTVMGRLRAAVSALAALDLDPAELLHRLHELTTRLFAERPDPSDDAATEPLRARCLVVVYDPVTTRCALASADHPLPLLLSPGERPRQVGPTPGPPLGQDEPDYAVTELDLPRGSVLALHNAPWSDASAEALRGALARDAEGPLQEACDRAAGTLFPEPPPKDMLLLLARTRRLADDRTVRWQLTNDPESPGHARRLAVGRLHEWDLGDLSFATEMIVSELVTNAVRYTEGPISLRLIRESALICEVSDGSSTAAHVRHAAPDHEGGRGLFLVAQVASAWGTRFHAEGKTIWAEQPLPEHVEAP
ncbi:SpoIIE family protein phosphatase [Streptomyces sp. 3MP-14]|uniref:SpoIIE family protein phosphatase n=1 Tax=Streptomyces mimosae TaxID=2586635 RepID=A0A5N6ALT1_9ACTN|nr:MULTISPECIES: SpoIIE family protein phosphatase [Streptomyces]KAB8169797.1 SpoIIE family protein phosphatase [Streptomyces mimosae]KAB8178545.1 SpoIIE family protein phosphatase [Streptomyces sp. 3MP-14]